MVTVKVFASFDRKGDGQLKEAELGSKISSPFITSGRLLFTVLLLAVSARFERAVTSMALGLSDQEIREARIQFSHFRFHEGWAASEVFLQFLTCSGLACTTMCTEALLHVRHPMQPGCDV